MSRRRKTIKRTVLADPVYGDVLVTKIVNTIMKDGKKSLAERVLYGAMEQVKDKMKTEPLPVLKDAVRNVKPMLEVKSRRVGGATYQVPVEVRPQRQTTLAIRWLIGMSRNRSERDFKNKLAAEIMDAANRTGAAMKKKEDTHKMAEANKAFSHYRW